MTLTGVGELGAELLTVEKLDLVLGFGSLCFTATAASTKEAATLLLLINVEHFIELERAYVLSQGLDCAESLLLKLPLLVLQVFLFTDLIAVLNEAICESIVQGAQLRGELFEEVSHFWMQSLRQVHIFVQVINS